METDDTTFGVAEPRAILATAAPPSPPASPRGAATEGKVDEALHILAGLPAIADPLARRRAETGAFESLQASLLAYFGLRLRLPPAECEELVQRAIVRVVRYRNRILTHARPGAYFWRIARSVAMNRIAKDRRRAVLPDESRDPRRAREDLASGHGGSEERVHGRLGAEETLQTIDRAVAATVRLLELRRPRDLFQQARRLEVPQSEEGVRHVCRVWRLAVIEGANAAEVARALGFDEADRKVRARVRKWKSRGRRAVVVGLRRLAYEARAGDDVTGAEEFEALAARIEAQGGRR